MVFAAESMCPFTENKTHKGSVFVLAPSYWEHFSEPEWNFS